jgi:hypothetical protein
MNDYRFHEMTYADISKMFDEVLADRDRWRDIAKQFARAVTPTQLGMAQVEYDRASQTNKLDRDLREWADEQMRKEPAEKTQRDSLLESLEFVVDMMNNGNVNPEDVYPKGRYQGD